jgi:hypothetical protein
MKDVLVVGTDKGEGAWPLPLPPELAVRETDEELDEDALLLFDACKNNSL